MAPTFRKLTLEQFAELFAGFQFTRRINAVHLHHTFKPNHATWRGHETVVGMWRHHTEQNGWSDIAQHITIDPEGQIWTGRNWNQPPASATGHNGSAEVGPFMIEMVGDFDIGRDRFEGAQREAALEVITIVQTHFGMIPETLRFHRDMSRKTCPGSSIQYEEVIAELRSRHAGPERSGRRSTVVIGEPIPFGTDALAIETLRRELVLAGGDGTRDPVDAEPDEEDSFPRVSSMRVNRTEQTITRQGKLTAENLAALRPFVINLRQGEFSDDGLFATSAGDVDAIFEEQLPREIEVARARGVPPRIVLYAHGGLVSESAALMKAHERVDWWKRQGIYPIYFVWETGLFETIGQLLERTRTRAYAGARDVWDYTTDPVVEAAVRALRGPTIWGGMKRSAERACMGTGGALHTAMRIAGFCAKNPDVELHAVGHSAGSIFMSYFLPSALNAGARTFKSVHFLAPAVRTDVFRERLGDLLGSGIDSLTIYTMRKDLERADNCKGVYRKSLLYLIHHALEPEPETPLLGLEESLRGDIELRRIFGLGEKPSPVGNIVWSPSVTDNGRNASRATTHGGFDDDPATMDSITRRILDLTDADVLHAPVPALTRTFGWEDGVDWPERLQVVADRPIVEPVTVTQRPVVPTRTGRRRALLVGIDQYPISPLSGCVADARLWARTLGDLGFEPTMLVNEQATRSAILDRLNALVATSAPGDVLVFQFSGHGTQFDDLNGDDHQDDKDEAICPYDMTAGAFIIDDDLGRIFDNLRPGVNLTCFIDCCHSGTISRLGVGRTTMRADQRVRFIRATPAMEQAHLEFRSRFGTSRATARGPELMKEVLFAACEPFEVALETNGQGDFTQRAVQMLSMGTPEFTNEQFLARVKNAFGATPRQHPRLDCPPSARTLGLLQPFAAEPVVTVPAVSAVPKEMLTEALRLISLAVHA